MTGTHRHIWEHDDQPGQIDHHHGFNEALISPTAVIVEQSELDRLHRIEQLARDHIAAWNTFADLGDWAGAATPNNQPTK